MSENEWDLLQKGLDIDRKTYIQSLNESYLEGELNDQELMQFAGDVLEDPKELDLFMGTITVEKRMQNIHSQYNRGQLTKEEVTALAEPLFGENREGYYNYIQSIYNKEA